MFPDHTFNETDARLEPLDTTCIYCRQNDASGSQTSYLLQLYLEKGRTNLIVFRSVRYGALKILVPRCISCRMRHTRVRLYARTLAFLAIILAMTIGFLAGAAKGGLLAILPAIGVGVYTFSIMEKKLLEAAGIPTEGRGAQEVPLVQELLANGWTMIAPAA